MQVPASPVISKRKEPVLGSVQLLSEDVRSVRGSAHISSYGTPASDR